MKTRLSMIVGAVLAGMGLGPAAAEPIPADAFAKRPALSSVSMSPEGDFLVGLVQVPGSKDGSLGIAVWELGGKIDTSKPLAPTRITPGNDRMKFVAASAIGSGKLIAVGKQFWTGQTRCLEGGGAGATKTVIFKQYYWDRNIDPKKYSDDFAKLAVEQNECSKFSSGFSMSRMPLEPGYAIATTYDAKADVDKTYKVNLATQKKEFLYQSSDEPAPDYKDPRDGKILTKQDFKQVNGNDYEIYTFILNPKTGAYDKEAPLTFTARARNTMNIVGHDDATGKYYVATDKFSDKVAIYFYDPATDKFSAEPVFAHPKYNASAVLLGNKKHNYNKPLGFIFDGAVPEPYYIDPEYKSIYDGLKKAFPGKSVSLSDSNEDLSRLLFEVQSSDSPPAYYLLLDKSKVVTLGSSRPWMAKSSLSKTTLVSYTARDGLEIPAFLTPAYGWKKGDKPAPAIILPHGGPWARDYADFDSSGWTQYLASRGYHVLQPQYRGSEGFGMKLWKAGDNEWGQKMQDDKDDGAAWLVSQGYAAKDRMAIFGYSYGGFAAFAATVRENSPYQCAVAGAGVSNLELFRTKVSESRIGRAVQGHTMTGMDPLANASKAKLPIFIFHGDRDVRVPIKDGRDFYNAVKDKVPAKFLEMKDMFHQGVSWEPQHFETMLTSLDTYLKNDCGPGGL